jgi:hypothetical protein
VLQLRHARWGIAAPGKLEGLQSFKIGIRAQKEAAAHNTVVSRETARNTHQPMDHPLVLFTAPISSIGSNHHNEKSNSLQEIYASGTQSSLRSVSVG